MPNSYANAGVNVEAGYDAVKLMKEHAKKTFDKNVLSGLGSFGGFYALENSNQVLVSGTDGVGTKLRLAMIMDKHDTIGMDCVAMCVNDVVCHGARPLFFLDYLAVGKLVPEKAAQIVGGVAQGCLQAGCALIGGETAEMPGFYEGDDYDLAGFAVGVVDRDKVIDGSAIAEGDAVIGLASSGIHSNGYSLVRKVFDMDPMYLDRYHPLLGRTLGRELLEPTRIYVKSVLHCIDKLDVHGIAHITGGGFIENIPRIIPDGLCAQIDLNMCPEPAIFRLIREEGGIDRMEMYNIFNMGIGMVMVVPQEQAGAALRELAEMGERAAVIGKITKNDSKVELIG